ncbi:ATP-binding cassette domain-containing protein [Allopusillimonas ginsengisoli]|uniref:ATP-binding cassette domain-containing protein n=1 Tax=Allopusillimonas ginsengisoli TaxID=453575 RepID=UPI001020D8B0|nr:ATP-binding cassette domain-containing protein [Allopusillimonas ginsengisoli]TEA79755.1 sugar ABC transporter ATP-binding protein [Allopusillimonas ginsengisoli]
MNKILELRQLAKRYGAVEALRGVDVDVHEGEVLAICGDNGAGKSTLIKVVSGAHSMSSGQMRLFGREARWSSPHDALSNGVATIYQDLALAPRLSIWQNVFLGAELRRRVLPGLHVLDKRSMRTQTLSYLQRLNQDIDDVDRPVSDFSGGQRQAVAIARALRWQARIVIMDEPTAALGVKETARVLALIQQLKNEGVTVLLISHNMDDVVRVADRVVILKAGSVATQGPVEGLQPAALAQAIMTGEWPAGPVAAEGSLK